ncbi:MAG: AAA family ATPase [Deltaproteobacteria bacterium]|nr:AAA family ATPase [Deltaproteobacteria bacterium]
MSSTATEAAGRVRRAVADAAAGLVEREALVEMVLLAAVAQEHLLVIGPPGTAKSEAVRRVSRALGGRYFEYLLGRFTEPSEIFGPVDLRRLREGVVETATAGMLPEAEVAFLDEVFQGSTAILNTLLGLLNERQFVRGHTRVACPLRVCVGASNALPEDPSLAAFADRFLLRAYVASLPDPRLDELLAGGWEAGRRTAAPPAASLSDVDALVEASRSMDPSAVRGRLADAIRALRGAGVALSDRRAVKMQRLMTAAAALAGRSAPTTADLWTVVLAVPTPDEQATAREVLREMLADSGNPALATLAEEASAGPTARAARLAHVATALLGSRPAAGDETESRSWRLRLEGVAREVDASFLPDKLPPDLRALRERIIVEVTGGRA